MKIQLHSRGYDPWRELSAYQARSDALAPGSFGACASFVGTMRDFSGDEAVTAMVIEHYPAMTEKQLSGLATAAMQQHALLDLLLLHRVGRVYPNDPIVLVAAWSAHRRAAFDACREVMTELKARATFWKQETRASGPRWVDGNTPD